MRHLCSRRALLASIVKTLLAATVLFSFVLIAPGISQSDSGQPATAPASPISATATPSTSTQTAAPNASAELNSRDEPASFKVNVKLVLVRVVARDGTGHALGSLRKEDFQIFDNRKPQVISQFSVEQPGTPAPTEKKNLLANSDLPEATTKATPTPVVPERYIAYIFDDVHLQFGDLALARKAAEHNLSTLQATDRVAIFSTSGQNNLDFTDDRSQIHEALLHLQPRPLVGGETNPCPDVTHYMGDLIQNQNDSQALLVATQDALHCAFNDDTRQLAAAQAMAVGAASQALSIGDAESRLALGVLKDIIRRISLSPGQRTINLVSPGFLTPRMENEYSDLIDRALRSQIIINTLDARGLYTVDPLGDIATQPSGNPFVNGNKLQYRTASAAANDDLLSVLADSTGGIFFHNSNDLDEGFRRLNAAPEFYYVLGFSPQNLKLDGSFHSLKVTVKSSQKLTLQSRRGYYAPRHIPDPSEEAKQEIEDAVFSQEEEHELPVELHTQFFKSSDADAKLTVLAHVDVRHLRFRKVEGRNRNDLTVVSALFDRNGNYIQGSEKILEMRLKDETIERKLESGVTLKSSFDVKPGTYMVRLVVRDTEGKLMSAENGAVQIP